MTLRSQKSQPEAKISGKRSSDWLAGLTWGLAVLMVVLLVYTFLALRAPEATTASARPEATRPFPTLEPPPSTLPEFKPLLASRSLARLTDNHTTVQDVPRAKAVDYTVEAGDSVFSIATDYDLKPESVLWANYDQLKDDPQMLEVGLTLNIPPVDGVYYKWRDGDTVEGVASKYHVDANTILSYPGNRLDMANPQIAPETFVMVPGGTSEFRQWVVPTIPRGKAGVTTGIDTCDTSGATAYGSGAFIWPAPIKSVSGNEYWGGHLGIDIAAGMGQYVYASDSGVVVYAGPISGGYGNLVMIDHGNGYQTLYAHNSAVNVRCGQNVSQGQVIALAGSSGNSTGPHLHFEVRYFGGFVNPWTVLP